MTDTAPAASPTRPLRRVNIVGIGAGSPDHLTAQAITDLGEVDVFLVADKGSAKDELVALRRTICQRFIAGEEGVDYRFVTVPDPHRGPDAQRGTEEYLRGVDDWHAARAAAYAQIIEGLDENEVVGFLVWGDPAFYDSTIRIVDTISRSLPLSVRVVPGISAVQLLAAEHGIVLNGIGQAVHLTTGRRLLEEWTPDLGTVVVMLDGRLACAGLVERAPDLIIHWGAYLGLPYQELRSGRLADIIDELTQLRTRLRAEHGWIMDTYALSSPTP